MIGKQLKNYKLLEVIGTGGMSTVYLGRDINTGRLSAVKILKKQYTQENDHIERFFTRQIKLTGDLDHPNIVRLLDYGKSGETYFLVYELIQGISLDKHLKKHKLSLARIESISLQILSGLSYAHQKGLVHRDIKPQNILITPEGIAKITDFGIARALSSSTITRTGMFIGSPGYVSPEQADGKKVDTTSDLYSFGVVLFEMLARKLPFTSDTPWGIVNKHINEAPPDISKIVKDIPAYLSYIVAKCLVKNPSGRFLSADEIIEIIKIKSFASETVIKNIEDNRLDKEYWKKEEPDKKPSDIKKVGIVVGSVVRVAIIILISIIIALTNRSERQTASSNTGYGDAQETEEAMETGKTASDGQDTTIKKAGGEFRAYIQEPVALDPPNAYESEGIQVSRQIYDGLVEYDPVTMEIFPAMAESWVISDDGLVYTFKLKEGVKFHSGRECTAEDFVYSWSRVCQAETASYLAYHMDPILGYDELQAGEGDTLEGVKAIDAYTLEVTLKYPYADFINTLGHVVFYPVAKEDIEQWGDNYSEHANGTGAFKLVEWKHDQYITLERFDDYYGENAMLETVKYVILADENTAFLEYKAGNLDYCEIPQGKIQVTLDDPELGDEAIIGPQLAVYYFAMNYEVEPFKDNLALREALNYAVDRQNIIDVISEGVPSVISGVVPRGIVGWVDGQSKYIYDVGMAKEKLIEAGYPGGEGLPVIDFGINIGSGHELIAEAVQADFNEIGVNVNIVGMEWGAALDAFKNGEIGFFRLGWIADYPTMDNFLFPLFYSTSADNYQGYNNPEVDAMLLEARSIRDEDERIAKYREIEKEILDDSAFILMYQYGSRRILKDYVKGFELSAAENYDLSTVWMNR